MQFSCEPTIFIENSAYNNSAYNNHIYNVRNNHNLGIDSMYSIIDDIYNQSCITPTFSYINHREKVINVDDNTKRYEKFIYKEIPMVISKFVSNKLHERNVLTSLSLDWKNSFKYVIFVGDIKIEVGKNSKRIYFSHQNCGGYKNEDLMIKIKKMVLSEEFNEITNLIEKVYKICNIIFDLV